MFYGRWGGVVSCFRVMWAAYFAYYNVPMETVTARIQSSLLNY